MEPIKILSKEITPKCISLRPRQLPSIFNPWNDVIKREQNNKASLESTPYLKNMQEPVKLGSSRSEAKFKEQEGGESLNMAISSYSALDLQMFQKTNACNIKTELITAKRREQNTPLGLDENSKPVPTAFKSKSEVDYFTGKTPPFFSQQIRFYHKKTDTTADDTTPVVSSGVLSKEVLLNHHTHRNASHFSIFDPAMTAINLSALQPSRAGFNVRKLISKSYKENWNWGLPSEYVQVKTEGPGINDSLIDFVDQKMRIQADVKRKFKPLEEPTNTKIRSLINKARTMNMEAEKQRLTAVASPPDYKEKRLYRTVSNVVIPENKERSPTKTILDKTFQRKVPHTAPENFATRSTEAEKTILNKRENSGDLTQTAYQPSASYKEVFYNIFNKTHRKSSAVNSLSVFNRPALESGKTVPKAVSQSTVSNVSSFMSARGKSEKLLDNEQKKSQSSLHQPSMKDTPRTPFQKVKDSLFTKSAKASFSTVPKTKGKIRKAGSKKKEHAKGFSTSTKQKKSAKSRVIKPYIRTAKYQKRDKFSRNVLKSQENLDINILKASYSMLPKARDKNLIKTNSSGASNSTEMNTSELNKPLTRTYFSYCRPESNAAQYKALQNSFLQQSLKKESNNDKTKTTNKSTIKRHFHTQNCTVFEPVEEKVFNEFLNLCEASKKMVEGGRRNKSGKDALEDCRCSLNEKKQPDKKGLVCRLAGMLNLGCGRDGRCPPQGCSKCGKS